MKSTGSPPVPPELEGPVWVPSARNYWWRPARDWYLDSTALFPGDMVLFTPHKPDRIQKQIIAYQGGNKPAAARTRKCTHAAI